MRIAPPDSAGAGGKEPELKTKTRMTALPAAPGTVAFQKRIRTYSLFAYFVFIAGYFLTPNAVDHYKYYLGFLFLPGLLLLPRIFPAMRSDSVLQLGTAYLVFLLLSSLWGTEIDTTQLVDHARLAILILFFVAITGFLSATEPKWFDILVASAILVAAGNALLSVVLWDDLARFPTLRLTGFGTMREPNSAGAVYGFYGLLAVIWCRRMTSRTARAALFLGGFALLGFLLLTQSRAAILACVSGLAILAALNRGYRPLAHLLVLAAVIIVALFAAPGMHEQLSLRSVTWDIRLELWSDGIRHIANAPLFGNGYLSALEVHSELANRAHSNLHNSYLATLRDTGIAGFGLLIAFLAAAAHRAWQAERAGGDHALLALLCFGLVYMLTSTDSLITRPRELWVILWFPIGLLTGHHLAATGRQRMDDDPAYD